MERLNLCFKFFFAAGLAVFGFKARAINLHALYTASCTRDLGIILNVTPRQIFLLTLKGEIKPIERFEVISYATYPLDVVPVQQVNNPQMVPLVRVMTFQDGEMVQLLQGWPVDFSQDKIAFLTLRGSERLIERRSVWEIHFESELQSVSFTSSLNHKFDFVHPYAFSSCKPETFGSGQPVKVYPQQLLSDPVAIKRELDRLVVGHEGVKAYESDQQFYPVPEVYGNETTLGMWLAFPSRYGASENRQNNFTPFLTTEYSSGPFGFQREFKSGAGPILHAIHEEPQTQIFYRMKADYFHFSAMVDPGLMLVGSKYKWFAADLDDTDIRANDSALMEFGFDYGPFALEFHMGGATNVGARKETLFNNDTLSVPRIGARWQGKTWILNVFGGSGSKGSSTIDLYRANLELARKKYRKFVFSVIHRKLSFNGKDSTNDTPFTVESTSQTFAGYGYWRIKTRYWAGAMLAAENLEVEGDRKLVPKVGGLFSLSF
ncbi:MAG: hypothetical protein AB7F86_07515 [Bdellovibrionales bacterium]